MVEDLEPEDYDPVKIRQRSIPEQLRYWSALLVDIAGEQARTRNEIALQGASIALEIIAQRLEGRVE